MGCVRQNDNELCASVYQEPLEVWQDKFLDRIGAFSVYIQYPAAAIVKVYKYIVPVCVAVEVPEALRRLLAAL